MKSEAKTVIEYLRNLEALKLKQVLGDLRAMVRKLMPKYQESMQYGMPTYSGPKGFFAFNSQKNYISLYVDKHDLVLKHTPNLGKMNVGKSCIRYRKPEYLDFASIEKLLREAYL